MVRSLLATVAALAAVGAAAAPASAVEQHFLKKHTTKAAKTLNASSWLPGRVMHVAIHDSGADPTLIAKIRYICDGQPWPGLKDSLFLKDQVIANVCGGMAAIGGGINPRNERQALIGLQNAFLNFVPVDITGDDQLAAAASITPKRGMLWWSCTWRAPDATYILDLKLLGSAGVKDRYVVSNLTCGGAISYAALKYNRRTRRFKVTPVDPATGGVPAPSEEPPAL